MDELKISTPEELDAVLSKSSLYKRDNLLKIANGGVWRLADAISAIVGFVAVLSGLYGVLVTKEIDAVFVFAMGIILIGIACIRRQQAQIDALRKLFLQQNSARD
jgi:hypothetical protein